MVTREREILIWLCSLGIGNSNIEKLMNCFLSLDELWSCRKEKIYSINNLRQEIKEKIVYNRNKEYIEKLFKKIEKENINVITIYDDNYPNGLRYIDDCPKVLFAKGNVLRDDRLSIGIVGSRKATTYGKWACEKFTKELVNMGVTIVSGLASGIDTVAHRVALDNGGRTIGILGNGIDIVYPKRNLSLYKEMELKGAIISEFPIGTPPLAFNFPQRNRIISGISLGIIVIEAQEKSGSLITAHHALEQGKDVFALPGNINSIFSSGTNKLIKDGAKPLLEIEDILEEFHELKKNVLKRQKESIDYSNFSETEIKIIKILEDGPLHSDMIAQKMNMDISNIISILTILELKNVVKELSGRVFTIY